MNDNVIQLPDSLINEYWSRTFDRQIEELKEQIALMDATENADTAASEKKESE